MLVKASLTKRKSPCADTIASNSRVTERRALACSAENYVTRSGIRLFGIVPETHMRVSGSFSLYLVPKT